MPKRSGEDKNHEIYHSLTDTMSLTYSGGELKVKESSTSSGYGVRVLDGGRLGFSYTQMEDGINDARKRAKELSKASPKTGFSFPGSAKFRCPVTYDPTIDPDSMEDYCGIVEQVRDEAASYHGKPRVVLSASRSNIELENTEGFHGNYKRTSLSVSAETMDNDGYGYSYFAGLKSPKEKELVALGSKAAGMAKEMKGAKKPGIGTYTVVMELDTLSSLLDTLMPSFSGDWKRRKMTKLKEGQPAFSEKLTLTEDGLSPGADSRPFDDEGIPSTPRVLIERGRVGSFMYDRETAALSGFVGGGCCGRSSFGSMPAIMGSNLVISPGGIGDFSGLGKYIQVYSAHGAHTANPTTGAIGLEVTVAFLCEGGKRTPLRGFMISGNIFDMFRDIEGIESRQQTVANLISPRIAFRNLKVVS